MKDEQKQNKKINEVSTVIAGVTGAAIGIGIGVAGAAVVLNDKKNREKAKKVLTNAKKQVIGYVGNMQKQAQDKKSEVVKDIAQGAAKTKKKPALAKVSLKKNAKKSAN